jgi:glycosyltransferase involved in cell wall biosynthesis
MKYPAVLFFRLPQYSEIDAFLDTNVQQFECSLFITGEVSELNKLLDNTYHILVSYGQNASEYYSIIEPHIVPRINKRWVHYTSLTVDTIGTFNRGIQYCFIHNVLRPREDTRPTFSVITTTYNSFHKIQRAYKSLLEQTMRDWEWVIIDDSPTDEHFQYLREHISSIQNHQIRLYRRDQNSGSIGNVKNEAVSLARGKYVLELDHDDEITPDCLRNAVDVFESDLTIGFVYMDFYNMYENGENFKYSDFISFGYGGYYCQKHKGAWRYVYITPNVNNITASALIALPNHPRMWRRDVLLRVGNYSEMLPICDDMEILLRTFAEPEVKIAKIHKIGYIQYMNEGENNFSLIRNQEINRLGPQYIYPQFYHRYNMHTLFRERGAYEDVHYLSNHSKIWKRPAEPIYEHKYCNQIIQPDYDTQVCILGKMAFQYHFSRINGMKKENVVRKENRQKTKYDFIVLESEGKIEDLWAWLEERECDEFKCYVMSDMNDKEWTLYFHRLFRSCDSYIVLDPPPKGAGNACPEEYTRVPIEMVEGEKLKRIDYNTEYAHRHEIINAFSKAEDHYLEIGVEYGYTFSNIVCVSKTGVDPSPKMSENSRNTYQIQRMTSDAFFQQYGKFIDIVSARTHHVQSPTFAPRMFRKYDVVFIDGMHQVEYVIRDINHSVRYLAEKGRLFLDDILPQTEKEQKKIPEKHYYEEGVLKYGEAWTGDVWKVVYYLLMHYRTRFQFSWFHHPNYRGVFMIYDISPFEIPETEKVLEEINGYEYTRDYADYLAILQRG